MEALEKTGHANYRRPSRKRHDPPWKLPKYTTQYASALPHAVGTSLDHRYALRQESEMDRGLKLRLVPRLLAPALCSAGSVFTPAELVGACQALVSAPGPSRTVGLQSAVPKGRVAVRLSSASSGGWENSSYPSVGRAGGGLGGKHA